MTALIVIRIDYFGTISNTTYIYFLMRPFHFFLSKRYMHDPAKTAETIDEDGWMHSGDIATFDDDEDPRVPSPRYVLIFVFLNPRKITRPLGHGESESVNAG